MCDICSRALTGTHLGQALMTFEQQGRKLDFEWKLNCMRRVYINRKQLIIAFLEANITKYILDFSLPSIYLHYHI